MWTEITGKNRQRSLGDRSFARGALASTWGLENGIQANEFEYRLICRTGRIGGPSRVSTKRSPPSGGGTVKVEEIDGQRIIKVGQASLPLKKLG